MVVSVQSRLKPLLQEIYLSVGAASAAIGTLCYSVFLKAAGVIPSHFLKAEEK